MTIKLTDHVQAKATQYKQNAMMIHMMAQQALGKAGIEYFNVHHFDEAAIAIIDAEIERRLGGKRVNGKRVS